MKLSEPIALQIERIPTTKSQTIKLLFEWVSFSRFILKLTNVAHILYKKIDKQTKACVCPIIRELTNIKPTNILRKKTFDYK